MQFGYRNAAGKLAIETVFQQLLASLPYVGQMLSQIILSYSSKYYGRKASLRVGCAFGIISLLLQLLAKNQGTVLAGRVFLGFSNMLFYTLSIVYSAETAPPHLVIQCFPLHACSELCLILCPVPCLTAQYYGSALSDVYCHRGHLWLPSQ